VGATARRPARITLRAVNDKNILGFKKVITESLLFRVTRSALFLKNTNAPLVILPNPGSVIVPLSLLLQPEARVYQA
jgi:hypothetical protein